MHPYNIPIKKRLYEKDSFTLTYGLQLYSYSSNHYDKLREKCNFLMLPDKRILFSRRCKSILLDIIFSPKQNSGYTTILQKIYY